MDGSEPPLERNHLSVRRHVELLAVKLLDPAGGGHLHDLTGHHVEHVEVRVELRAGDHLPSVRGEFCGFYRKIFKVDRLDFWVGFPVHLKLIVFIILLYYYFTHKASRI